MKITDIPQDTEPRVGDIIEIEQGEDCFEVRIIGITADGYLCEQDNIQGAVLLEGVDLDHSDVSDITGYIAEEKVRLDPKCWKGKKIGNPKTKMKGGVRVNNCVPEGRFDEPLTGWHIVYRNSGNPVHATPSFETKEQAQKYLMTKMFANHQDFKVVHTAGVGMAEGSDLPPKVIEMIKKIAQSSASPEHKKAAIDALVAKYSKQGVAEGRYKPPKNTYYVMQTSINSDEGRSVDVFDLMYNGKIIKRYNLLASADRQLRRLRAAGNPVQMENEQGVAEVSLEECDMSPLSMPAAMQQEQSPDRYTLNIQRGDKSLNVTTDSPDELLNIMKLAGINSQSVVAQRPAEESNMHEEWENTPIQTNEREPRAYGDIRDWGFKGTGKGKPGSALNRPAGQGDNPLGETAMMEEYKQFKSGK